MQQNGEKQSVDQIKDQEDPIQKSQDAIDNSRQVERPKMILNTQKDSYFSRILDKHRSQALLAEKALENLNSQLRDEIMFGKYDIKERVWPQPQSEIKNQRPSQSRLKLKKQLEADLQNVESRLKQQNSNASRVISDQERLNFIKRLEQQKKELLEKRKEYVKLEEQHRAEEEKRQKQQLDKAEIERKNKKRDQILQKLKQLDVQRKAREDIFAKQETILKQKMSQKTYAQKMHHKYMQKQNDFLEEKKKRLAEIRDIHNPIDRTQLDAHAQRYEQFQHERVEAAKLKAKKDGPTPSFYKSVFYKKTEKEEKSFLDSKHEQELHRLKEARDRLKRFSEHVRTDCRPIIDERKVQQIKFRSQNLKHRSFSSVHKVHQNPRKIGLRYLQFLKIQIDHKLLAGDKHSEQSEEVDTKKKIDYLTELREKNKNAGHLTAHALIQELQKKQLPKEQKAKKIWQYSQRLQQKAKRMEELEKLGGGSGASEELDSLYLQAIEAKLSLLQDL